MSRPKTSMDLDQEKAQDLEFQNPMINDIIVKIEMKKFQNLIDRKLKRKNHLTQNDILNFYPMNKVGDGSA